MTATLADQMSIVLFDGICSLCNQSVLFIIDRDPKKIFRFASMQSPVGQKLLSAFHMPLDRFDTFVLIDQGTLYTRSTAALRIARKLNGLWPMLYGLTVLPRALRDFFYDMVARNRYRLFGKKNSCMVPSDDICERFLDNGSSESSECECA